MSCLVNILLAWTTEIISGLIRFTSVFQITSSVWPILGNVFVENLIATIPKSKMNKCIIFEKYSWNIVKF